MRKCCAGEPILWWGVFLVAMSAPAAAWSVVGPTTITFLLLRVSGVRMLEKGLSERRPQYADCAPNERLLPVAAAQGLRRPRVRQPHDLP